MKHVNNNIVKHITNIIIKITAKITALYRHGACSEGKKLTGENSKRTIKIRRKNRKK